MKNFIAALVLTLVAGSALAQHRPGPGRGPGPGRPGPHYPGPGRGPMPGPHYPGPRPGPFPIPRPMPHPGGYSCRVLLLDRYNRPVRTFFGSTDWNGMCSNAFQQCNWEQRRMGGWGTRCIQN